MVRSRNPPPNDQVEKAHVTIKGIAYPPGRYVNNEVRMKWEAKGYFIDSEMVLVEEIIEQQDTTAETSEEGQN